MTPPRTIRRLADLTWPAAGELAGRGALLAVPVGSTEQHGPHLPLSTDTDIAVALCESLAAARPAVVVAPAVAYGASGEHAGFAGTLSIGRRATENILFELGRSATATFGRVLFVSAHGGNATAVVRAVARLRAESRDVRMHAPHWDGDPHAGAAETSMLMALRPDAVRTEHAAPGDPRPLPDLMPLLRVGGLRAVTANGILGDPTGATAAQGRELLGRLVTALVDFTDRWQPVAAT